MLMGIIAILSFTGAVVYGFAAALPPAEWWKCALIFVLGVPALTALYVLYAFFMANRWQVW